MSSKTKLFYILIGILLILASVKAGIAVQEDFNAYAAQKTAYVCGCASSQDDIVVENTGDVTSTYSITQTGDGSQFSSLTETAFNLKPGESRTLTDFIRAPCGVTGDYELTTQFETVFGMKKEFSQTVHVNDCVNVNLLMMEASVPVCPCSPAKYTFMVENTGTFLETYKIGIDSDYAELSEDILILEPQQAENVTVFITTPCGSYGDLGFTISAFAEQSEMLAELPFALRVAPCYNYTMEAQAQYSVCENLNNVIPVKIKNTADVKNTYFLSTDADWALFENSSINLWGSQEGTANLNVYPVDVGAANYNLTINAVTARGEIRKSLNLAANVENCYSLNLSTEYDAVQVVNGEKSFIPIKLGNDGTRASEYSLNITGPEWTGLELGRIGLDPNTEKEIKIDYDVPVNESGEYNVLVSASMVDFPDKARFIGTGLEVVSVEDAYMVEIDTAEKDLDTNFNGRVLPITITNLGIREGKYGLLLYGENWTSLNKSTVTLAPQQTETMGLVLSPIINMTPEGKYTATIDAVLNGTNIAYSRTFDIKLRQKTLFEKVKDFFSDYWLYVLLALLGLLVLVGLIAGAIVYRKKHPKDKREKTEKEKFIDEEKPGWLKRILLILLILLILSGIGLAGYYFAFVPLFGNVTNTTNATNVTFEPEPMPEPIPEPVTNATIFVNRTGLRGYGNVIEVAGLENITIPLIIQNSDEPNTYIIRVNENITWIKTDKSIVNIPPNKRETINIYVMPTSEVEQGNYNLSVNIDIAGRDRPISEEIVLSVKEKKPFYEEYFWYIVGGILALVLLLIIIKSTEGKDGDDFDIEPAKTKKTREMAEPRDYSRLKNFLVILILALIALAIIGGMIYVGINVVPALFKSGNQTGNATGEGPVAGEQTMGGPAEEPGGTGEVPEPVEKAPEEEFQHVFVKKNKETYIPIKITNINKTTTFRITVKEDVEWLYVENATVEVGPNENRTIYLTASPNSTVDDGNYKVSVNIDIAGGEKMFSKYFVLKVRKSRFSDFLSYLYYIIGGLVVLVILIKIIGRKGDDFDEPAEKKSKKRTNIKLKK